MKNTLTIPKKLKVGYQKREDTYTKMLAYVTSYDERNVLRKARSWESWRDKKIDASDFDNVPTDGFVINKGGGGARRSYGWNVRNEFARVYDPRGFEIEIGMENLLFILQECSCNKGKGIEGEMVYAWDRAQLILLPISSQEYKESLDFFDIKKLKLAKGDIQQGSTYLFKNEDREEAVYLGKHTWYGYENIQSLFSSSSPQKHHIFRKLISKESNRPKDKYIFAANFNNVAKRISEDAVNAGYAEKYEELIKESGISPIVELRETSNSNLFDLAIMAIEKAISKNYHTCVYWKSLCCIEKNKGITYMNSYSVNYEHIRHTLFELTSIPKDTIYTSKADSTITSQLLANLSKLNSLNLARLYSCRIEINDGVIHVKPECANGYIQVSRNNKELNPCIEGAFVKKNGVELNTWDYG